MEAEAYQDRQRQRHGELERRGRGRGRFRDRGRQAGLAGDLAGRARSLNLKFELEAALR